MSDAFDAEQLEAITGGDPEFEREILEEYLATAPHDIARLKQAAGAADAAAVSAAAHALKGASATIGAKGLAAVALELELAGKSGQLGGVAEALARLDLQWDDLATFLRSRLARAA